ncbi:hypothetical protein HY994_06120 [Candidatus Micrarchaeota archaeon]|nr:hypothetical protein [Candidatus Micrarchaeota archaeon]
MAKPPLHTWMGEHKLVKAHPELLVPAAEHLVKYHGNLVVVAFHPPYEKGPAAERKRADAKEVLLKELGRFINKNKPKKAD